MNQKFNIENEKRDAGFSVPDNFFNELEVNIQNRISSAPKKSWIIRYKYILSGAAASIIAASLWLLQPNNTSPADPTPEKIDYTLYINDNIEEFDDDLIYESYAEASNPKALEEDVYKAYLIDEEMDDNALTDEL
jgi:hypothetical protein